MGHFKTFLLGVAAAYGVYFLTRKRADGSSMLDDILDDPEHFITKAKNYAVDEAIRTVKQKIV